MKRIRWGILGCGRIARKFASDLKLVEGAELVAVASRSQQHADEFAQEFPAKFRHNSYEALAANAEVDVIYVASPHGFHYEHTMLCLRYKKAVLCEKAFAINHQQANDMIAAARNEKVFLMEALWTKFLPHYQLVQQMIKDNSLGDIKSVLINFGFVPAQPIPQRLFDPKLGGGALLDIGIYTVFMALSALGRPDHIEASIVPADTGVDAQIAILFKYDSGAMAQLFSSFLVNLATDADISGTKGRLRLTSRFYEPSAFVEFYPGRVETKQVMDCHKEPGFGYQYEARHVCECLRQGLTESPIMRHEDTLLLMETLDRIREIAELRYEVDGQLF